MHCGFHRRVAKIIVPYCKRDIVIDDELLLKGLMIIYNKTNII